MSKKNNAPKTRIAPADRMLRRRYVLLGAATLAGAAALGLNPGTSQAEDLVKSGTVTVEQVQVAFIGSGNLGGGALKFKGKTYKFKIGGLGIGGFGVSKMEATGEVYNLTKVSNFPGAYGQARYGAVAGDKSTGELWLQNPNGVVIRLTAKREGLALSLGGDAVYIEFN